MFLVNINIMEKVMTAKDLIKLLKSFDGDAEVYMHVTDGEGLGYEGEVEEVLDINGFICLSEHNKQ
jgi:hypothetical protein